MFHEAGCDFYLVLLITALNHLQVQDEEGRRAGTELFSVPRFRFLSALAECAASICLFLSLATFGLAATCCFGISVCWVLGAEAAAPWEPEPLV